MRLLRAELGHGLSSRLVALGHGLGDPPAVPPLWVPAWLTTVRISPRNRPRAGTACGGQGVTENTGTDGDRKGERGSVRGAPEWLAAPAGLFFPGPGEVRLRRREDRAEDPNDTANRPGLASEVDQDDADHARHDGSVHQVLPRNRRGGPKRPAEDDVDHNGRRNGGVGALRNARSRPLNPIGREGQEDRQEAAQHQKQLVRLLRADLGHGLSARLVAVGHGFGPERRSGSITVPSRLPSVRITKRRMAENHYREQRTPRDPKPIFLVPIALSLPRPWRASLRRFLRGRKRARSRFVP